MIVVDCPFVVFLTTTMVCCYYRLHSKVKHLRNPDISDKGELKRKSAFDQAHFGVQGGNFFPKERPGDRCDWLNHKTVLGHMHETSICRNGYLSQLCRKHQVDVATENPGESIFPAKGNVLVIMDDETYLTICGSDW